MCLHTVYVSENVELVKRGFIISRVATDRWNYKV